MSSLKQLAAARRERVGKGAARAVRREARVPAVIYGAGSPPVAISLDYKTANQLIYAGHFLTTIFEIDVDGEKIRAIPRDYQLDPVKDTPLHVDFLRLTAGSKIRVDVPVHVTGQEGAPGIKRGGILNIVFHKLTLNVPADAIPDDITIDITGMDIGDSLHVSAITLPMGCTVISNEKDVTLVTISTPGGGLKEEEPAPAAVAAAPAAPAAKK